VVFADPGHARGNLDRARRNGLTTNGDESQLASLFGVLQPGNPTSTSSNPDRRRSARPPF
jgi:hypothetical protein